MSGPVSCGLRRLATVVLIATVLFSARASGAKSADAIEVPRAAEPPGQMSDDAAAVWLAMRCAEGGEDARSALVAALDRMGWGVKDREGNLLRAPAVAEASGLAMRDYEIESLFWNAELQPGMRLISYARSLAVAMPSADPEDIAQSLLDSIREGAESAEPRRRFWARFIIALGMAQDGSDLAGPGDPQLLPADPKALAGLMPTMPEEIPQGDEDESDADKIRRGMALAAQMMSQPGFDIAAIVQASTPKPMWPHDDPVLGRPVAPIDSPSGESPSPEERMEKLQEEMNGLFANTASADPSVAEAAARRLAILQGRMTNLNESIQAANHMRMEIETDPDFEPEDSDDEGEARFMAEHRATPLSALQIALITRVVVAELVGQPPAGESAGIGATTLRTATAGIAPLPRWLIAQAQPGGPPTSFSGQIASAGADIWATATGTYTNLILDLHLPESGFADKVGKANAIMGWFKTLVLLFQNKITIEVENDPLIRTKRRDQPGQQRRVKCTVEVEFPKTPDAVKALRGILNIASIDLQVPDGGPQSGAKVTWRITEGGAGSKYQTANGGKTYRTDLAVVEFAQMAPGSARNSAYVSYSDDKGEAFITIQGTRQKKTLPQNVREKKRRAAIAVEVTMKVGNLMQDLNDAIGAAGIKGSPGVLGVATMISEMIQRSSLFFQKGRVFGVIDWVPPAWEGDMVITVKGSGSKNEKGEKGGEDVRYEWSMNRAMEAHVQTPEWEQDEAHESGVTSSDRIVLEIANDSKRYKVTDFSAQTSRSVQAAFTAEGPVENPPKPGGGPAWPSRAEPSGFANLTIWPETDPPKFYFTAEPSFYAKALIFDYERSRGRSRTETKTATYSLMSGVSATELSDTGTWDPESQTITGTRTIEARGSLPYVPDFDVVIEFAYTLRYVEPPPENAR